MRQQNEGITNNNTILVVLMNQDSCSSAERLIDNLHRVNNTIFVGTNSYGSYVSSKDYSIYTLHSNINITFGSTLKLMAEDYFEKYVGFKPDIYYFGEGNLEKSYFGIFEVKFIRHSI